MATETNSNADLSNPRPCTRCHGTGRTHSQLAVECGIEGPEGRPCTRCNETGSFPGLDIPALIDAIFTTGKVKKFRKSFPSKLNHYNSVEGARAYYVWRMARFHGGADVCMPMTADLVAGGDPFIKELDKLAEIVAKKVFGTDMAAAYRWGRALGYVDRTPAGLPPSAYEGGPVADENKPWWEGAELH